LQLRDIPGAVLALKDVRVRKALSRAIDREGIAGLQPPGFTPAGYYMMSATDRLYPQVEQAIPKDTYDPAAVARLLDDAGYQLAGDGIRRSATGDELNVPYLSLPGLEDEGVAQVVARNWADAGVTGGMSVIPQAQRNNAETRATFPGAHGRSGTPNFLSAMVLDYTTSRIPTEANHWAGTNLGGYSSPETDRVAAAILTTLDMRARDQLVIQFVQRYVEDDAVLPISFKSNAFIVDKAIGGYEPRLSQAAGSAFAWNIYEWTLTR
jgi:peptide/nickel transport system substrate-binding protein